MRSTSSNAFLLVGLLLMVTSSQSFAFVMPSPRVRPSTTTSALSATSSSTNEMDRRSLLSSASTVILGFAGLAAAGLGRPGAALAIDEVPLVRDKMGGLLEQYTDIAKGLKVARPSGWNQFEGSPETYVVKWSDIINRDELVILNSTPVKASTTSVETLGDVQEVGKKLAKARNAELVEAKARVTEGVVFYEFEFKGEPISEVYNLCVNKGRLWALSATSATKRWPKRRELLKNVLGSFLPKL